MPKRLRIFFRFDRELLKRLPNLAWQSSGKERDETL